MLLADQPGSIGTTVFVPGSHRLPVTCRESGAEFIPPAYLSPITRPASGHAGDIFLFFKKTWHGRLAGVSPTPSDALILAVFPVGYEYVPFQPDGAVLQTLGPELARLLDPERQLQPAAGGRYVVTDSTGSSSYHGPPRLIDHVYRRRRRWHPLRAVALVGSTLRLAQAARRGVRAGAS
jgi:ectoine hydroxylase-related dioxygenase (phytanoyl-CoA dioxygenase family)